MAAPANERPPNKKRGELPKWVQSGLEGVTLANTAGAGKQYWTGNITWHIPGYDLLLWAAPARAGLAWIPVALCWPAGFGLLVWALLGLRTDQVMVGRWGLGAALLLLGTLGVTNLVRWLRHPGINGTLVTADGIVVVAGHVFRFASREDIHEVSLKDGRLVVVWGPERKHWCLYSEVPGSDANAELEKRREALSTWLTSGTMPAPDVEGQPHKPPPRLLSTCVKLVAGSAGMLAFLWLTLVLPATSDSGRVARDFVQAIADGDFAGAHAMLTNERQMKLSVAQFEAALSPTLKQATGFTVNGISGSVGVEDGATTCVDGWLDDVSDPSGYAFELVREGGEDHIESWREGACHRSP